MAIKKLSKDLSTIFGEGKLNKRSDIPGIKKTGKVAGHHNKSRQQIVSSDLKSKLTKGADITSNIVTPNKSGITVPNTIKIPAKSGITVVSNVNTPQKKGTNVINNIITPSKKGQEVISNIITPDKKSVSISNNINVPTKRGTDVSNNIVTPSKGGVDASNNIITPEKKGISTANNIFTPVKSGVSVPNNIVTPVKSGTDVTNNIFTPNKMGTDVPNNIVTPDKAGVTVPNNIFVPEKLAEIVNTVDYFSGQKGIWGGGTSPLGFTPKFIDKTQSKLVSGTNIVLTPNSHSMPTNDGFSNGISKLGAQLGKGSPKFEHTGFTVGNKYESFILATTSPLENKHTTRQSPSFLDKQYGKFNLRDASFNRSAIPQPYILRGIQQAGRTEPQRYGFGGIDERSVRGGMSTALERSAVDTARLASFFADHPRGTLFLAKHISLQLTNPRVDVRQPEIIGTAQRRTRIYTELPTLAQVPVNAFGIHLTRHGTDPVTNLASTYQKVTEFNENLGTLSGTGQLGEANRLVRLKKDLLGNESTSIDPVLKVKTFLSKITRGASEKVIDLINDIRGIHGERINILSGTGGPNSLGGIGETVIRRYVVSNDIPGTIHNTIRSQYYSSISAKFDVVNDEAKVNARSNTIDDSKRTLDDIEETGLKAKAEGAMIEAQKPDVGSVNNTNPFKKQHENANGPIHKSTPDKVGIKAYASLAYDGFTNITIGNDLIGGALPQSNATKDFRRNLDDKVKFTSDGSKEDYLNRNIYKRLGLGNSGEPDKDRSDFTKDGDWGVDQINNLDVNGDLGTISDLIKFRFSDSKGERAIFRATLTGLTDNFNPSWTSTKYSGRPDPVYTYDSTERDISFNFKVAAMSRQEMAPLWKKLNWLAAHTYPEISQQSNPSFQMIAPIIKLTIGDYFVNTPGFIKNLTYTVPDEAAWEINFEGTMNEMPQYMEITVGYQIIGKHLPSQNKAFFDADKFIPRTSSGQIL